MEFTTHNEAIDAFTPSDQRIDIIGYVENVIENPPPPIDHVRLMFTLNNNRGRTVLVCVWNQVLKDCKDLIKPNAILHIANARCKIFDVPFVRNNSNARINDEAFEIHINHPTTLVRKVGEYKPTEVTIPPTISWERIRESDGKLVRLRGFIKGEFAQLKHNTYGSITDGRKKLNIVITKSEKLENFKIGELIEIEGKINVKGYRTKWYGTDPPGIELDDVTKIKKIDTELNLLDVMLMNITAYP